MTAKHDTSVELLIGPPDDYAFEPGETFHASVAVLPQNNFPTAITQIFLYVGPRGGEKKVYKLLDCCPWTDPNVQKFEFEYTVPHCIKSDHNSNAIFEIGWGQELQYTWEDAMKCFQEKGQEDHLLHTLPVAQPSGAKHDFKVDLCSPLSDTVVGGDVLIMDLATLLQNNLPNAISQLLVYIKDGSGAFHACGIQNTVPGERPPLLRRGVAYYVSESLVGQTLEIGWASDLQYTFQDAAEKFNNNPFEHCLGFVKVLSPDHPDAERAQANPLPQKLQEYVTKYFSGEGKVAADLAKYSAKYGAMYVANEGLKMGACRLAAAEMTKMALKQAAQSGIASGASMKITVGSEMSVKYLKMETPVELTRMTLKDAVLTEFGGESGSTEKAGEVLGGLTGAVSVGADSVLIVPCLSTATNIAAGAVTWNVGKAGDGIFSLF